jgi:flagellar biosynthesis chaperone FliJ
VSKRDEYVEKMKQQLGEWNTDLDRLEAKVSEVAEPVRDKLEPQLSKVRDSYASARRKLREVREASEESWEDLTDDVEHVWKTLRQSINYFKSQLKRPDHD